MTNTEIKKALYKQKPQAKFDKIRIGIAYYSTMVLDDNNEPFYVKFEVPVNDMGEADYLPEMDAKLLNRYITNQ